MPDMTEIDAFSKMFKNLTADLTGSADVCKCIPKDGFNADSVMQFLLPGEIPYILLKSKKEDHLFTNLAYIRFVGANATTTRRMVDRFDYFKHQFHSVQFETAGMGVTDRDVELKFNVGSLHVSIDIWKNEIETAITYYKVLLTLAHHQARHQMMLDLAKTSLSAIKSDESTTAAFKWAEQCINTYLPVSYEFVFQPLVG